MAEQFTNDILDQGPTLTADVTTVPASGTVETWAVSSTGPPLASGPTYSLRVDNELVTVTAVPSSTQVTVVRGQGGTATATHASGAKLRPVVDKGALDRAFAAKLDAVPTATVSMNGQRLSDLSTPVNPNDAAPKVYVDGASGIGLTLASYGAVADGQVMAKANMALNSAVLTLTDTTQGSFPTTIVGKPIVVGAAGHATDGTPLRTTVASRQSATQVTLNATALAAVSNTGVMFGTDNSLAIIAALAAIDVRGGATLTIPAGDYYVGAMAYRIFTSNSTVRIQGEGSASRILVGAPKTSPLLNIQNLDHLVLEHLTFVGCPGALDDAQRALHVQGVYMTRLVNTHFYGVACKSDAAAAVVFCLGGQIRFQGSSFRGCGGRSNGGVVVVQRLAGGAAFVDTEFFDYGTLRGIAHAKGSGKAWIAVVSTAAATATNSLAQGQVRIENCIMDEGVLNGLYVDPDPTTDRVDAVYVSGMRINNSSIGGGAGGGGLWLKNVRSVIVEQSWFGYASVQTDAIVMDACDAMVLRAVRAVDSSNRITVQNPPAGSSLLVEDCAYTTLVAPAPCSTNIRKQGHGAVAVKTKAGTVSDADFDVAPPNGTLALDESTSKLSVRVGGVWKTVTVA